jgi:tetratricopeptide (TPR) repeat protein
VAKHAATQDLAAALNVHFLIRGNLARTPSGLSLELRLVDASTERVLDTRAVAAVRGPLTARNRYELDEALRWMTYVALLEEVQRARAKPLEAMDVRDLSFRAYADWGKERDHDGKQAHTSATQLLNRALALAPDDSFALYATARINLCDCVEGWSRNVAEQQAVGFAALEKFLRRNPESIDGLGHKASLFAFRGQYEEALVIADTILKKDPESVDALHTRAFGLLRLGKPREALVTVNQLLDFQDDANVHVIASAVHYQLGNDELAASHAQKGAAKMPSEYLSNGNSGSVLLTWIAAEGRLGRQARARTALATFRAAVPGVKTVSAMRAWIKHNAELAGYEPLFDGLRRAGVPE